MAKYFVKLKSSLGIGKRKVVKDGEKVDSAPKYIRRVAFCFKSMLYRGI